MPRPLRIEYPGALYVMDRRDRREAIIEADKDRHVFLTNLGETSAKTGWEIHAYFIRCLALAMVIVDINLSIAAGQAPSDAPEFATMTVGEAQQFLRIPRRGDLHLDREFVRAAFRVKRLDLIEVAW